MCFFLSRGVKQADKYWNLTIRARRIRNVLDFLEVVCIKTQQDHNWYLCIYIVFPLYLCDRQTTKGQKKKKTVRTMRLGSRKRKAKSVRKLWINFTFQCLRLTSDLEETTPQTETSDPISRQQCTLWKRQPLCEYKGSKSLANTSFFTHCIFFFTFH